MSSSSFGLSKEKNEEAIIIPAEKASIESKNNLLISLKNKTKADPKAVIRKVKIPASRDCSKVVKDKKKLSIYITSIKYAKLC